jgi:hypothetical protein
MTVNPRHVRCDVELRAFEVEARHARALLVLRRLWDEVQAQGITLSLACIAEVTRALEGKS